MREAADGLYLLFINVESVGSTQLEQPMNREEALKKSDEALKELAQALKEGKSEKLLSYLNTMSKFHRYSFGNCMLIAFQKPDAGLVAGFGRWKELGRSVRKGEKGIAILAPMVRSKRARLESQLARKDTDSSDEVSICGFRVVHVFDVSQTEGEELTEFAQVQGEPDDKLIRIEGFIRSRGIELEYAESLPTGARGMSAGGKIWILSTLPKAEMFSTLVHEVAHELLHRGDRRDATTKVIRETEAEAVAYVVCRGAGLECSTHASDYIQLWDGNETVLMQSLELIRNVASSILAEMETDAAQEGVDHAA